MIHRIWLEPPNGETLDLVLTDPDATGIAVKAIDGLGPAKATINTTALSLTDSAMFNGSRVGMRTITLTLKPLESPTIESARYRIYNAAPIKQAVAFGVETDKRLARTVGYVESCEPDIFSSDESIKIVFICPDGYWTDAADDTERYLTFKTDHPTFEFDWMDDPLSESPTLEFGKTIALPSVLLRNEGDVPTGFTLKVHILEDGAGPVKVFDDIYGQSLEITGKWMPSAPGGQVFKAGDRFFINTRVGQKSVYRERAGKTENVLHMMSFTSEWLMLHPGDNRFYYTANKPNAVEVGMSRDVMYQGV